MIQWEKLLHSLGFTDSQAKIYLVSLEMGPAPVQDLAKKAGVSRVTTYAVIEELIKDGLMSTMQKGKKKLFVAESPERLLSFVHSRMKNMEATLREMESMVGDLRLLQRGEKPVVKLFEGKEAMHAIQDDVLRSKPEEAWEFGNLDELARLYPLEERKEFFNEFYKLRTKRRSFYASKQKLEDGNDSIEIKTLPSESSNFFGDIYIYGNKVALSTLRGKQISVLIESQDLADTFRAFFGFAWKQSPKR